MTGRTKQEGAHPHPQMPRLTTTPATQRHAAGAWIPRLVLVADQTAAPLERISGLLHEAGETHHHVFRIVDGADDDWASWYADWLANLSELPAVLGAKTVRSELTWLLVSLDKEYTAAQPGEPWETYYAQRILSHFSPLEH